MVLPILFMPIEMLCLFMIMRELNQMIKLLHLDFFQLCRFCKSEKSSAVSKTELQKSGNKVQQVSLVASVPLSGEEWSSLKSVELLVIRNGRVIME